MDEKKKREQEEMERRRKEKTQKQSYSLPKREESVIKVSDQNKRQSESQSGDYGEKA